MRCSLVHSRHLHWRTLDLCRRLKRTVANVLGLGLSDSDASLDKLGVGMRRPCDLGMVAEAVHLALSPAENKGSIGSYYLPSRSMSRRCWTEPLPLLPTI